MIVTDRCQGCGACLLTCPEHAIRPHGRPLLVLDELCTGCGECIEVCPVDAIEEKAIEEKPGTIEESPCVIEESSCAIK
ncbi:4Fe-4S binding protein [Actinomadura sp. 6N118]|uniref:indolepyruvate ferredoxin oxidoreductase subunit alpha n=1 Tax=Actinomadura sp. 6N118 TaxID=3375151 RepID=UPI0037B635F4